MENPESGKHEGSTKRKHFRNKEHEGPATDKRRLRAIRKLAKTLGAELAKIKTFAKRRRVADLEYLCKQAKAERIFWHQGVIKRKEGLS